MEASMTLYRPDPIENAGSGPDTDMRRTGGTPDDPHSGRQRTGRDNNPDRPHLARQPGPKPGFGPDPNAERLVGNPELGIDPRDAAGAWESGPKAP
jgi:hypothetical protein